MTKNQFSEDFYRHLRENTLTGIRVGTERTEFLNIWMVNVEGRIFARSWGKSPRSWFTALLNGEPGQIRYAETLIDITGVKCTDSLLNKKIDQAYRRRYTTPENIPYALGITQPEYADFTMEFRLRESGNGKDPEGMTYL